MKIRPKHSCDSFLALNLYKADLDRAWELEHWEDGSAPGSGLAATDDTVWEGCSACPVL